MFKIATLYHSFNALLLVPLTKGLFAFCMCGTMAFSFADDSNTPSNAIKLRRVELFPAGQGVFEYGSESIQDSKVNLALTRRELDDVLKSFVLQGFDGVQLEFQRELAEKDSIIAESLQSDPSMTRAELLQCLRGNRIRLINETGEHVGRIVTVEHQPDPKALDSLMETVTLATADGLIQLAVVPSTRIRFEGEGLEKDLDHSLDQISETKNESTIDLGIMLSKREPGPASFAYQSESAPWKCAYRITKKDNKAALVVSAVIDNVSHITWEDIELVLIVDQPLVFHSPLSYVHSVSRASLPLPTPFSATPPNLLPGAKQNALVLLERAGQSSNDTPPSSRGFGMGGMGGMGGMMGGPLGGAPSNSTSSQVVEPNSLEASLIKRMGISFNAGELNREAIGKRVHIRIPNTTIPSKGSSTHFLSSIPHEIRDIRVYVSDVHKSHALSAFEITLRKGYQLPGGPGTVWSEHGYSGDIMIPHLIADVPQMITYAVDQDLEIQKVLSANEEDPFADTRVTKTSSFQLVGQSVIVEKQIETRLIRYKIKNQSPHEKQLILEHVCADPMWKVVTDTAAMPVNSTLQNDMVPARFELLVPPQTEIVHEVREERSVRMERTESTALNDLRTAASNPQCPNELKVLLGKWIGKRETKDQIDMELSQVRSMLSEILAEQKRLQQSITAVNRSDAIYDRYLEKLDEIESEIERKNERIVELYRLSGERKGAR
ncbi:MAG: hypothetical protein ACK5YR_17025 [Pirellula sp.]|jgi:hypothetical protein